MNASQSREQANKVNKIDTDRLDDGILDGIGDELAQASAEGKYSIEYEYTIDLSLGDLLYCIKST